MNTLPLAAACAILLAATIPLSPPVNAGTSLQRCEAPDGATVYTDVACSALGAEARPIPAELLTRVAREEAIDIGIHSDDAPALAASRRSLSSGCARSTTQLVMDLQGAIALGDVNRLAESYHWAGMTTTQSRQIMQRLDEFVDKPLVQAHFFDARIGGAGLQYADASASHIGGDAGVVQLMFDHNSARSVIDFDVQRYQGCYFVRF